MRVAAVTTAAESFVPGLLRAFSRAHPDVRVTLDVGNRARVLELLTTHAADVAFGGSPPRDARLEALPILPNELALITAARRRARRRAGRWTRPSWPAAPG